MEDALKNLDKLTHEEARMAVAQNLKATHNVDERVRGIANTVQQTANDVDQIKRSSLNLISAGCSNLRFPLRETITRQHSQMALPTRPVKKP